MKQCLLIILLLPLFFSSINAQDKKQSIQELNSVYEAGFYRNRSNNNIDSALFYARKLTLNKEGLSTLRTLIHSYDAIMFFGLHDQDTLDSEKRKEEEKMSAITYSVLNRMTADTNKILAGIAEPLFLCIEARYNKNDDAKLEKLVNTFITTQFTSNNLYENRVGRYALLMYDIISPREALKNLADQLLDLTVKKLKPHFEEAKKIDLSTTKSMRITEETAWYRWMYVCANNISGNNSLKENKINEAGKYFKIAYENGSDFWLKKFSVFYYFDMIMLFQKEKFFDEDYFAYLTKYTTDKDDALTVLLKASLNDPSQKGTLRSYYNTNFPGREKFDTYWETGVNNIAKAAPDVLLKTTDGVLFSLAGQKGKWVLLDFWGTWCVPCRAEHPQVEKLYQNIKSSALNKVSLVTIACRDNEKNVTEYMQQTKYSFPVVMADGTIEKNYHVEGYPSKFLITPQGKYIPISLGVDWFNFVKNYTDL